MLNILINAYACSPTWGSEPGMAWNWVVNLSRYCEVYVITEGEWREDIERTVSTLPQRDNIHFYYNEVSDKVRKMCWNQGDWRFYYYYKQWQKKTLVIAEEICRSHKIDILHQLNMIGFREPGYLWRIKDIPFVWGPIGGMELIPTAYLRDAPLKENLKNRLKNIINAYQARHSSRVLKALNRADALIAAVKGVQDIVHNYHGKEITLINETGCYPQGDAVSSDRKKKDTFDLLWVGKFDFRKQLSLAIKTLAALDMNDIRLHIAGTGTEDEIAKYKSFAVSIGVNKRCIWHGKIAHEEVLALMESCDVFLFTSIMEGTPHVVLEAIGKSLPVVCFNTCGQAASVDDSIGMKVELSDTEHSVSDFARCVKQLYDDRDLLNLKAKRCIERQKQLSWDSKAKQMVRIYKLALKD